MQGLYVEMKFEKPSRIQATTLPMIMTPPYKDLIAQVRSAISGLQRQREHEIMKPGDESNTALLPFHAGTQRVRQDNMLRAVHAQQV